ncbi:MAG: hypothetical protein JNL74_24525 [Fibrobacteres bacterium]|nr:hypothetical protein [Fibrobacterota bacterium]
MAQSSATGRFCAGCGAPVGSCQCSVGKVNSSTEDTFELSSEGKALSAKSTEKSSENSAVKELSEEEKKQVAELKKRDTEVRAHEAAHMAAGAGIVRGGASYSFQKGPDGRDYAVGGEVSIDSGEGKTPEETILKMNRVRAAAMAPASPSGTDIQVAAEASAKANAARAELAKQNSSGSVSTGGYDKTGKAKEKTDGTQYKPSIDLIA